MRTRIHTLSNLIPSLEVLRNQWFGSWGFGWKKLSLISGITVSISVFSSMYLHSSCAICLQCSQKARKRATSMPRKPLADCSEHTGREVRRASGMLEDVVKRTWLRVDPWAWPWRSEAPSPFPCLWNIFCLPFPLPGAALGTPARYTCLNPGQAFIYTWKIWHVDVIHFFCSRWTQPLV